MHDRDVRLPPKQFNFTAYLGARPGQLTPAKALLQDLWGEVMDTRKVHLTAHRVRRNLGEPVESDFFVARRSYGYGFFPAGVGNAMNRLINASGLDEQ
jgi:DNA-binding response OmpR family regulator